MQSKKRRLSQERKKTKPPLYFHSAIFFSPYTKSCWQECMYIDTDKQWLDCKPLWCSLEKWRPRGAQMRDRKLGQVSKFSVKCDQMLVGAHLKTLWLLFGTRCFWACLHVDTFGERFCSFYYFYSICNHYVTNELLFWNNMRSYDIYIRPPVFWTLSSSPPNFPVLFLHLYLSIYTLLLYTLRKRNL